ALLAKFGAASWPDDLARPAAEPLNPDGQVVFIAGSCDAYHDPNMQAYGELLNRAFADYRGTIISGGTKEGISGLVGKLASESEGRIRVVGYLPEALPTDGTASRDERYDQFGEIRRTDGGKGFSARQPIQNWLDLLAAGIRPRDVRLLGING